ncbi:TPA: DUF3850 domain-containing protein [Enterococcus faecalis]|nr:DUF3850 domain-containing protein [Enterococcus faecalis]
MPYLTNKEVQIINFLIKDGIKAFDFRGGFRDCWFTVKESNELANKVEKISVNEYQDGQYTGRFHVVEMTYITDYGQQDGYVVLGIK